MKTTWILFLFLVASYYTKAQLVFEINSPDNLRGVYPCMAGKSTEWGSPNLYQNGTWFSDTILLADDGVSASACAAQTLDFNGKIAIFRLNTCSMSQSLLNVQNAGAAGALIIDDYTGRPLPFDADENSLLVTIPFVLISKTQGDQLLDALNQAEDVSVSFGDKTGVHAVDLGLYMETSLWMRYANQRLPNPNSYKTIDETNYGAWIYNQGSSDAENIQLRLYFSGNNYQEYSAAEVNINAGDSLYVAFELTEAQLTVQNGNPHIEYGYYLNFENDEDSLDNKVSNRIKNSNYWSHAHATYSSAGNPYLLNRFIPNQNLDTICVYHKVNTPIPFICGSAIATIENPTLAFHSVVFHDLFNWNFNFPLTDAPYFGETINENNYQNNYLLADHLFTINSEINEFAVCLYSYDTTPSSFTLGYSTEMYHDERIRQEGKPFVYSYNNGEIIESNPRLMPVIPIVILGQCYWELDENDKNTIQFFPNPNNGKFHIVSENGIENIQIFHLSGQQVANLNYANTPSEIELQLQLVPGMYLIKVKSNGEDVVGKMIVE